MENFIFLCSENNCLFLGPQKKCKSFDISLLLLRISGQFQPEKHFSLIEGTVWNKGEVLPFSVVSWAPPYRNKSYLIIFPELLGLDLSVTLVNLHFNCDKRKVHYLISWCRNFVETHVAAEFLAIRLKLCANCPFPPNFQTRTLSKTTVFYAVRRFSSRALGSGIYCK